MSEHRTRAALAFVACALAVTGLAGCSKPKTDAAALAPSSAPSTFGPKPTPGDKVDGAITPAVAPPAVPAAADPGHAAAVSPPANANGTLPASPGTGPAGGALPTEAPH